MITRASGKMADSRWLRGPRQALEQTLKAYGGILFVGETATGAICLLATAFNPRAGLSGLGAVLLATLMLRLLNLTPAIGQLVRSNALLVGLALGTLITDLSRLPLWLLAGVFLTTAVSAVLADWCWRLDHFSPLSLPFVLSATALTTLVASPTLPEHLPAPLATMNLPEPLTAFGQALGAAYFAPQAVVGLLLFLAILARSRYLALLAVVGFAAGEAGLAAFHLTLSPDIAHWVGFNWILSAMAVGGIYTVPSLRSFLLAIVTAMLAGLLTAVTQPWLATLGLPAMACPFLLTCSLILIALRKRSRQQDPILTLERPDLPENNRERLRLARFRGEAYDRPLLRPPFAGSWTVYQGFNGKHTHQPPWQYAVDFIQTRRGMSFTGTGEDLGDYLCFSQPVLSPAWGEVVAVENRCTDNPPGTLNTRQNWGNYVLLRAHAGCYVLLAHLQQDSIGVIPGQTVTPGQALGRCGNSGRSAQPHLHLHVQSGPQLGDATRPFALCGVEELDTGSGQRVRDARNRESGVETHRTASARHHLHLEPSEGMQLRAPGSLRFSETLGLQSGREFHFLAQTETRQWQARLQVDVDLLGRFRLRSDTGASLAFVDSGVALALFDRLGPLDPLMDAFALALGLLPNGGGSATWEDRPSISLLPMQPAERLLAALRYPLGTGVRSHYQRHPDTRAEQWHLIGSHQCRLMPGQPLEVETRALIDHQLGLRELSLYRSGHCLLHARLQALGGARDMGIPDWQARIDTHPALDVSEELSSRRLPPALKEHW